MHHPPLEPDPGLNLPLWGHTQPVESSLGMWLWLPCPLAADGSLLDLGAGVFYLPPGFFAVFSANAAP